MNYTKLLRYLWRAGAMVGREFEAFCGERVTVLSEGEQADTDGVWLAAEIVVDGERRRGSVAVGSATEVPADAILRVVEANHDTNISVVIVPVLGVGDTLVTQVEYEISTSVLECYDGLMAGSCAKRVAALEPVRRVELLTALMVRRLQRKTARIEAIFEETGGDWNQTFHVLLFQSMGGDRNKLAFTTLAGKATSIMASREKSSQMKIEALLLGAAGLLFRVQEPENQDDYTKKLEEEACHLFNKYGIVPMKPAEWELSRVRPANHPAVRLAELAALISRRDFMLDGVLKCRVSGDIEQLFAAEAGEYWRTHYVPSGTESEPSAKTIGRSKARLIGINLAAPLMFVYGKSTGNEALCERSLDLLTTIPAEHNSLLNSWYTAGCEPENAFESQALMELEKEFCQRRACAECRVGRAEIKKML